MRTYNEAVQQLPADAAWSCSFGYPGEGGFTEYYRTPAGKRYIITNGRWDDVQRNWRCQTD